MVTGPEPSAPEESVTAEAVELSELRAGEARERAAHAGLSAARSFEESARLHDAFTTKWRRCRTRPSNRARLTPTYTGRPRRSLAPPRPRIPSA